jgi:hypothetical protein
MTLNEYRNKKLEELGIWKWYVLEIRIKKMLLFVLN